MLGARLKLQTYSSKAYPTTITVETYCELSARPITTLSVITLALFFMLGHPYKRGSESYLTHNKPE
jgi:hypothetical protein